ncbi:MAG: hypothetical protein J5822_01430 [Eubacteriaceae bacterium]|nr:hypothetical protein [Eubacteriaceae bacterium]
MDYSAANTAVWNPVVQCGILAATILLANLLRRKVGFIRRMMMPTAVLGGFILLLLKIAGLIKVDPFFMEAITYHCIAIGFIATSLRIPAKSEEDRGNLVGLRSGAVIVGSYMIQAMAGLAISIGLGYTLMPGLFKAAGVLLPMGYGQGPGQANNIGGSYEAMGFAGGRSFGLALAAAGYVCACIVGVIYLNWLVRQGKIRRLDFDEIGGSVTIDTFQDTNEIPISESVDRFSVQMALVLFVYLTTFILTKYLTMGLSAISEGLGNSLNSLLWGFNFMIGSGLAIGLRSIFNVLKKNNIMVRQYQNNYLLSRISGFAFDLMIVAGIVSIELEDLSGLWMPFVLMAVAGAVVTLLHLKYVCRKVYPGYYYEGLISMYGMMTGTISSGVLLLREIDPAFETPAANNLVIGSSFAILLGAPLLVLVSMAPKSDTMTMIVLGLIAAYYALLLFIVNIKGKKGKTEQ